MSMKPLSEIGSHVVPCTVKYRIPMYIASVKLSGVSVNGTVGAQELSTTRGLYHNGEFFQLAYSASENGIETTV